MLEANLTTLVSNDPAPALTKLLPLLSFLLFFPPWLLADLLFLRSENTTRRGKKAGTVACNGSTSLNDRAWSHLQADQWPSGRYRRYFKELHTVRSDIFDEPAGYPLLTVDTLSGPIETIGWL